MNTMFRGQQGEAAKLNLSSWLRSVQGIVVQVDQRNDVLFDQIFLVDRVITQSQKSIHQSQPAISCLTRGKTIKKEQRALFLILSLLLKMKKAFQI